MSNNKVIDLKKFKRAESKVFTGRPSGIKARDDCHLDDLDKLEEIVIVDIPEETLSVNSSFFSGMFQKSLKDLGEYKFRKKYIFKCKKESIVNINIEQDIKYCLLMLKKEEV